MRPIKPSKMPEALELCILAELRDPSDENGMVRLGRREARAILAALKYERQRTEEALDFIAKQAKDFAGLPRGKDMDAFLAKHGRQTTEATPTYSAEYRRKQTAAVVPPKRQRRG